MQIAMIGLGRMGQNMAKRLLNDGHEVFAYDPSPDSVEALAKLGAVPVNSLKDLKSMLTPPRTAWLMVPQDVVEKVMPEVATHFCSGDTIVDGGNSNFYLSIKRAEELSKVGIDLLDVGVSSGIFGLARGYCLMIGGATSAFNRLSPIFQTLAPKKESASPTPSRKSLSTAENGYYHCGKSGSGHYTKMIHNAIEYGMMQSMAEGLEILHNANDPRFPENERFDFDLKEICEVWRRGSVVSSWLLDLLADALQKDDQLKSLKGRVPDSGEGRWALMEAIKQGTPAPNLANSLFTRFRSRQDNPFAEKVLSALRKEFGGHSEQ